MYNIYNIYLISYIYIYICIYINIAVALEALAFPQMMLCYQAAANANTEHAEESVGNAQKHRNT